MCSHLFENMKTKYVGFLLLAILGTTMMNEILFTKDATSCII